MLQVCHFFCSFLFVCLVWLDGRDGADNAGGGSEGVNERALAGSVLANSGMNVTVCVGFCKAGGYKYAGVEYSTEVCSLSLFSQKLVTDAWRAVLLRCGNCGDGSEGGGLAVWNAVWRRCVCILWGRWDDWGIYGECDCREHENGGVILKDHNQHDFFVHMRPWWMHKTKFHSVLLGDEWV